MVLAVALQRVCAPGPKRDLAQFLGDSIPRVSCLLASAFTGQAFHRMAQRVTERELELAPDRACEGGRRAVHALDRCAGVRHHELRHPHRDDHGWSACAEGAKAVLGSSTSLAERHRSMAVRRPILTGGRLLDLVLPVVDREPRHAELVRHRAHAVGGGVLDGLGLL
jgi:hypothetical protein